ncbi:MAG: TIGR02594 family protein [Acidiferrobacterales bacterium]
MIHTVTRGDTLASIAAQHRITVMSILRANPNLNANNNVYVGQQIIINPEGDFTRPTFGGGGRQTICGLPVRLDAQPELLCTAPNIAESATHTEPAWMVTAWGENGVTEESGGRSNPRIIEYFKAASFWGRDDSGHSGAWCGSFAAWVMKENGIQPVERAFRARSWENFGKQISPPIYGALGVKSGGGHVSFVVGQNATGDQLFMLGGNQGDKVQVYEYPRSVWSTFVVPTDYDESRGALPVYEGESTPARRET